MIRRERGRPEFQHGLTGTVSVETAIRLLGCGADRFEEFLEIDFLRQ